MNNLIVPAIVMAALLSLTACGALRGDMQQARANTKEIGLQVQSVGVSTATFQKQRDAIAVSGKIQRDALESLAMTYESDAYRATAAWNVAGQTERRHAFDSLRDESGKLLAKIEAQRAREVTQLQEQRRARSAVAFQSARLNDAAIALIDLAEPPSRKEEAAFFYKYVKEVRAVIKADSEDAAAAQTAAASKPKDKP